MHISVFSYAFDVIDKLSTADRKVIYGKQYQLIFLYRIFCPKSYVCAHAFIIISIILQTLFSDFVLSSN